MAHGSKYKLTFADRLKNTYEIYLKQKDYTGTIDSVYGTGKPLVYSMPDAKKYEAVKGMGGTIEMVAQSDRQLIDLYTVDYKGWVVEVFKNGNLDFTGYGEAELYQQPLKQAIAYPVSITINNGLALLKREKYVDASGNKYRGLTNIFEVVKICLEKILVDLPEITKLRVSKSLRINSDYGEAASVDGGDAHCVLELLVNNNDNFIDEDWESMNCYEVLQSVLDPLSYSLYIDRDTVYIMHTDSIRVGDNHFYEYNIIDGEIINRVLYDPSIKTVSNPDPANGVYYDETTASYKGLFITITDYPVKISAFKLYANVTTQTEVYIRIYDGHTTSSTGSVYGTTVNVSQGENYIDIGDVELVPGDYTLCAFPNGDLQLLMNDDSNVSFPYTQGSFSATSSEASTEYYYFYDIEILTSSMNAATEIYLNNFQKDITNLTVSNASFTIEAGYNNFILVKNRYVKNIIEEVGFNDEENYDGDPDDFVWTFGGLKPVIQLDDTTTYTDSYIRSVMQGDYWMTKTVGGTDFSFNRYNLNTNSDVYYDEHTFDGVLFDASFYHDGIEYYKVAFAGGIKSKKVVDGVEVPYDQDGNEYSHYIMINNPWWDLRRSRHAFGGPPAEGGGYELPPYDSHTYMYDARDFAFKFDEEPPYTFPSNNTMIRLHFTIRFFSPSLYRYFWNSTDQVWYVYDVIKEGVSGYTEEELKNDYGRFAVPIRIAVKDQDGVIQKYLDFANTFTQNIYNTRVPYKSERYYEWKNEIDQDHQVFGEIKETKLVVENVNDLDKQVNILNEDFETYVDIPANFGNIGQIEFVFFNYIYKLKDGGSHFELDSTFKEDFIHIGFKDIYTELVDGVTGEPIDLSDEELQFYLSENYKTEKEQIELTSHTGNDKYITDVSGILKSPTHLNNSVGYITEVFHESTHTTLEKMKGSLYLSDYQYSKIHLNIEFQENDIYPTNTFEWSWDTVWANKSYAILKYENDVRHNVINVLLENFYSS